MSSHGNAAGEGVAGGSSPPPALPRPPRPPLLGTPAARCQAMLGAAMTVPAFAGLGGAQFTISLVLVRHFALEVFNFDISQRKFPDALSHGDIFLLKPVYQTSLTKAR